MEHGNHYQPDLPVEVAVRACEHPGFHLDWRRKAIQPSAFDIDAKLAGLQSPRGWGLFLIKNMVDEMKVSTNGGRHTIELILNRLGLANDVSQANGQ
jgi:anti-sigma regulatory factor (Ser/Thr protein kinase)